LNNLAQNVTIKTDELQGLRHPAPVVRLPEEFQRLLMIGQCLTGLTAIHMPKANTVKTVRDESGLL
jgi:hypothetical protein